MNKVKQIEKTVVNSRENDDVEGKKSNPTVLHGSPRYSNEVLISSEL